MSEAPKNWACRRSSAPVKRFKLAALANTYRVPRDGIVTAVDDGDGWLRISDTEFTPRCDYVVYDGYVGESEDEVDDARKLAEDTSEAIKVLSEKIDEILHKIDIIVKEVTNNANPS